MELCHVLSVGAPTSGARRKYLGIRTISGEFAPISLIFPFIVSRKSRNLAGTQWAPLWVRTVSAGAVRLSYILYLISSIFFLRRLCRVKSTGDGQLENLRRQGQGQGLVFGPFLPLVPSGKEHIPVWLARLLHPIEDGGLNVPL